MAYPYEELAAELLGKIQSGEWKSGDRLPPISVLEHQYPRSRMTLHKALRHLVDCGYITMSRGRGTFVRTAVARDRIAILATDALFRQSFVPFAMQAYRHAHAFFAALGMDAQLYVEDPLTATGLPTGLSQELENRKLAGLITIDTRFAARYRRMPEWSRHAVPYVNIGAVESPHTVYVDRQAFFSQALAFAAAQQRTCVALIERAEHMVEHLDVVRELCRKHRLAVCAAPVHMPPPELSFEEYGFDLTRRMWAQSPQPDVLVVPDDLIAKGVAQAVLALGLSVPDRVMIIAMTNRNAKMFYPVPIVKSEVDVEGLTVRAGRMLVDLINGVAVPPQVILLPPATPVADQSRSAS